MKKIAIKLRAVAGLLILSLVLSLFMPAEASKVYADGIKTPEALQDIQGDGKYINEKYTYRLDTEELTIMDGGYMLQNALCNLLLLFEETLAKVVVMVFYWCITFDITTILAEPLQVIQERLHESMFEPMLLIVIGMMIIKMLNNFFKRNFIGILKNACSVIIVMIVAMLVVTKSNVILSAATQVSTEIGARAMASINSSAGMSDEDEFDMNTYAKEAAGTLWVNMFHEPWKELEFRFNYDEELAEKLLNTSDDDERAAIIKEAGDLQCFQKENNINRLGALLFYLFPLLIKSGIYLVLGAIQIFFQLMAVLFTVLALVVLVVSLFPGYETIVETWIRKMLEYQLYIILVNFIVAFLIWMDSIMFQIAHDWGWILVCVFQIVMAASLYFGRNHIFEMFQKLQKTMQSPEYANKMIRKSGSIESTRKHVSRTVEAGRKYLPKAYGGAKQMVKYGDAILHSSPIAPVDKEGFSEAEKELVEARKRPYLKGPAFKSATVKKESSHAENDHADNSHVVNYLDRRNSMPDPVKKQGKQVIRPKTLAAQMVEKQPQNSSVESGQVLRHDIAGREADRPDSIVKVSEQSIDSDDKIKAPEEAKKSISADSIKFNEEKIPIRKNKPESKAINPPQKEAQGIKTKKVSEQKNVKTSPVVKVKGKQKISAEKKKITNQAKAAQGR